MLKDEDALPRSEGESSIAERDRLARLRDRALGVRGHVVGSLVVMPPGALLGSERSEPPLEIGKNRGIGVLLDE